MSCVSLLRLLRLQLLTVLLSQTIITDFLFFRTMVQQNSSELFHLTQYLLHLHGEASLTLTNLCSTDTVLLILIYYARGVIHFQLKM